MSNFSNNELMKINEAIASGEIFHAAVERLGYENDEAYMEFSIGGDDKMPGRHICRISIAEFDAELERRSLMPLMGRKIPYVILGIDDENNRLICSRKQAQIAIKKGLEPQLRSGEVLKATVIKITDFGAFVGLNDISGVLRTTDFSTDHSEIDEYYKIGDTIEVVCKEIDESDRIVFRAKELHTRKVPLQCDVSENQVVMGKVRSLRTFPGSPVAFVRIAKGIDCLCAQPEDWEIARETEVAVLITNIKQDPDAPTMPPRIRGRIVRVL